MQNFLFFKIISNAAVWYFGPLNFPLYLDCLCTINIMYTWNNPYILTHVNYSHCMGVWGHTIILTPCPTTWSACSSTGKWAVMYLCVKGIDFASLSLSTNWIFGFQTILTVWYLLLCFSFHWTMSDPILTTINQS
jgi:hypothetical protein